MLKRFDHQKAPVQQEGGRVCEGLNFSIRFKNGEMVTRDALDQFLEQLAPLQLDLEEINIVQIILAEILNNILEHAYAPTDLDGPVTIACRCGPKGLHLSIRDQGRAMPDGRLPLGKCQKLDVGLPDLPEGGFGWFLIHDLARDLSYRRVGIENHLTLRIAISRA